MNYVGIDHHRQYSHIIRLDERGEVVKWGSVANLRRPGGAVNNGKNRYPRIISGQEIPSHRAVHLTVRIDIIDKATKHAPAPGPPKGLLPWLIRFPHS